MTVERAYCHKLMLEVGLTESFDQELDELLEVEDPLSELTLALSTCGGNRNEQIHILNDFICSVPKKQIDSDAVFSLVADEFWTRYQQNPVDLERITRQMHTVADSFGWDANDCWDSLWTLYSLYDEIEIGTVSEKNFRELLVKLLRDKLSFIQPLKAAPPQEKPGLAAWLSRLLVTLLSRKSCNQI